MTDLLLPHILAALEMFPNYRLVLTGHSLGAAVAAVITTMWIPVFPEIHCYAYAEPCVLSRELCASAHPYITALLHGDDMVPRFGLGSALDLRAVLLRLCGDKTLCGISHGDALDLLKKETMVHHKLYPAGTLLYIRPDGEIPPFEENETTRTCIPKISAHSSTTTTPTLTSSGLTPNSLVPSSSLPELHLSPRSPLSPAISESSNKSSSSTNTTTTSLCERTVWLMDTYDFEELVLSQTMFSAHLPNKYLNVLKCLPNPNAETPCSPMLVRKASQIYGARSRSSSPIRHY
jgi:hypothetical protein